MKKSLIWTAAGVAVIGISAPTFAAHRADDRPVVTTPANTVASTTPATNSISPVTVNSFEDNPAKALDDNGVDTTVNSIDDNGVDNTVTSVDDNGVDAADHDANDDNGVDNTVTSVDDNGADDNSATDVSGADSARDIAEAGTQHSGNDDSGRHGGSDDSSGHSNDG